MSIEELEYAKRKAMEVFDKWNAVTGVIEPCSGYYSEIRSVIEDAVYIGAQMAIAGRIELDADGNVNRS